MDVRVTSQGGQSTLDYTLNQNTSVSKDKLSTNDSNGSKVQTKEGNVQKTDDEGKVKNAVDKMNKLLEESSTHVEYEVHEKFKDIMIKIVDNDTKQVVQEIPSKKLLDMVAKLCEMAGIMLDKKA